MISAFFGLGNSHNGVLKTRVFGYPPTVLASLRPHQSGTVDALPPVMNGSNETLHDPAVWTDTTGAILRQEHERLTSRIEHLQGRVERDTADDEDRQALTVYLVLRDEITRIAKEG